MNAEPIPLILMKPEATGSDPAERREHPRRRATTLPWLGQARIKYGPEIKIIDLSNGGAQIETYGHSLQPGMTLVLEIKEGDRLLAVAAQVIRCQLAGLNPQAVYRGAVKFKRPLHLPIEPEPVEMSAHAHAVPPVAAVVVPEASSEQPRGEVIEFPRSVDTSAVVEVDLDSIADDAVSHPSDEYEHLRESLRRRTGDPGPISMAAGFTLGSSRARVLHAVYNVAQSARTRFSGTPLAEEISQLLRLLTVCADGAITGSEATAHMISRLQDVVPGVLVRVIPLNAPMTSGHAEALVFDIPAEPNRAAVGRLFVEFPGECELLEWHMRLLQVGAQLVGLAKSLEAGHITGGDGVVTTEGADFDPLAWNRVVIRYRDGSLLKGFSRDFRPDQGTIHLWSEPETDQEPKLSVPLSRLKAVFFVRDFEGNPAQSAQTSPDDSAAPVAGRRLKLSFADGEAILGTTPSQEDDPIGFYLMPIQGGSNNVALFVPHGAISRAEFS